MAAGLDFGWLGPATGAMLHGVATTIFLIVVTTLLGGALGVAAAAARRSRVAWLRRLVAAYVELIRNTPFIVQMFFIFFGLPSIGLRLTAIPAAILAMTVNLSAYGTEIVRAGLDAVVAGQREAGLALGLRPRTVFLRVVLPQALRAIYPALTSQIVITMLESAVVSQIAVRDLTYEADLIQSRTFRAFETYAVVTVIYLLLSLLLRRVLVAVGKRTLGFGGG
jgi:polar amino acid transport system permease protein